MLHSVQHGELGFRTVDVRKSHGGFGAEYERAHHARGAPSTVDHTQVVFSDLPVFGTSHHLTRSFDDVPETSCSANRLTGGQLSAIGVDRE